MQDKSYAIAIVVVLGICCLGMYVAISGYLNSNPAALIASPPPISQATQVVVNLPTETAAPVKPIPTQPGAPTVLAIPSPLGAFQTITAATTVSVPTQLPPPRPVASATPAAQPAAQSCAGLQFCFKAGPPDANLGPGGFECPRNYIWGMVTDARGKGLPNIRIRFRAPNGELGETVTKDKPDIPGKYDVLAPSGTFTLWLLGPSGAQASPQVPVLVQPYAGSGNCLTRVDFVQQQ
jgi:hypothetical protein